MGDMAPPSPPGIPSARWPPIPIPRTFLADSPTRAWSGPPGEPSQKLDLFQKKRLGGVMPVHSDAGRAGLHVTVGPDRAAEQRLPGRHYSEMADRERGDLILDLVDNLAQRVAEGLGISIND
ncbi:hypothetical protein M2302_000165 [Micromonospora sp. A200]|uniref:hypothetical protein n=1 Tax=Micromonospora sp. A200 TaxID=2940568 RepID=UPI002475C608|nr:hypothetical protein [Micromonospora sp. A200]MDH6460014.1 hypothetical protein [Micromonospora sp. A200]